MRLPTIAAACATAALLPLSGCSLTQSNAGPKDSATVTVTSSADKCELSSTRAKAGTVSFKVQNTGSAVTEFYLYRSDGTSIVGEVENIGPGLTRTLVTRVGAGSYVTACKPEMRGGGLRGKFTVTGSGGQGAAAISGLSQESIDAATADYRRYVRREAGRLVPATRAFLAAYRQGNDARARALYPIARSHWERIEPVAESFGDLDARTDAREADLEPGQRWTGWHRIEKDLWPPAHGYTRLGSAGRATYAGDLMRSINEVHARVQGLSFTVDQIGNGSKSLLDEVATGKITGEEEVWSHTDLADFQANVDGARVAFTALRPLLADKDPRLEHILQARFVALQKVLDRYRRGSGFLSYDQVSTPERKRLSDAVNALSEPLAQMTGAITL